ncbi:MAG: hypothetical protein QM528_00710 [Phycisphaerales bacterium]|nr:hypothetical protein [Phycisphaerales bacterium]
MKNILRPFPYAISYCKYWIRSANAHGYGIHAPFLFNFTTQVLQDKKNYYAYERLKNNPAFNKNDLSKNKIKYQQLFFRLSHYFKPQWILYLGDLCLMDMCYLLAPNENIHLLMVEEIADNKKRLDVPNKQIRVNTINDLLSTPIFLNTPGIILYTPTNNSLCKEISYLMPHINKKTVIIINHKDLLDSSIWQQCASAPPVSCTIDLFKIGLLLFSDNFLIKQSISIYF